MVEAGPGRRMSYGRTEVPGPHYATLSHGARNKYRTLSLAGAVREHQEHTMDLQTR